MTMSEELKPIVRPSNPGIEVSISSSRDETTIKIPCFLHDTDSERLYDVIFSYLKSCTITEDFISDPINRLES